MAEAERFVTQLLQNLKNDERAIEGLPSVQADNAGADHRLRNDLLLHSPGLVHHPLPPSFCHHHPSSLLF